jgi:hypothetical protein
MNEIEFDTFTGQVGKNQWPDVLIDLSVSVLIGRFYIHQLDSVKVEVLHHIAGPTTGRFLFIKETGYGYGQWDAMLLAIKNGKNVLPPRFRREFSNYYPKCLDKK